MFGRNNQKTEQDNVLILSVVKYLAVSGCPDINMSCL